MKSGFTKFTLQLTIIIIMLITCKSPSGNQDYEEPDNTWIEEMTIADLQNGYKDGKFTVSDIVNVYIDRIDEIDRNGPELNSVIIINPDALQIAEELDKELADGKSFER